MLWSELDLDAALWSIGKDRTKNGLPHDVRCRRLLLRSCATCRSGTVGTTFSAPATVHFRAGQTPRRRSTNG